MVIFLVRNLEAVFVQRMLFKVGAGLLLLSTHAAAFATVQTKGTPTHERGPSRSASHHKTFQSPDGVFHFSYPSTLMVCTSGQIEACRSGMLPPCEDDAIVCVAYPWDAFHGTNFDAAGFEVRLTSKDDGPSPCGPSPQDGNGSDGFQVSAKHPDKRIGHVLFRHGVATEAALGTSSGEDKYRTLYQGRCYELIIKLSESAYANYDPGMIKEFAATDQDRVDSTLDAILQSFRFSH